MKRPWVLLVAGALGCASALALQRWVVSRAVERAAREARALGARLEALERRVGEAGLEGGPGAGGPGDTGLDKAGPDEAGPGRGEPSESGPAPRGAAREAALGAGSEARSAVGEGTPSPSSPGGVAIDEARVLSWARAETIPGGTWRPSDGRLPAGLEIEGAGAFVSSLQPGDRLVAIDGAPLTTRDEVVRRVLEARGRGQRSISATFVRLTGAGVERFVVDVAQPYGVPPAR